MTEHRNNERSVFSSKFEQKPNKIQERINNAPAFPKVKKTRTQAVLTALPVLMLLVGLFFHWNTERQQTAGTPITTEAQTLGGEFDRITPRDDKASGKHFIWLRTADRTRPIRITYEQKQELLAQSLSSGDKVQLHTAPTVSGSNVLWLIDLSVRQ